MRLCIWILISKTGVQSRENTNRICAFKNCPNSNVKKEVPLKQWKSKKKKSWTCQKMSYMTHHVSQSIEDFWAVIVSVSIKSRVCVHTLSTTSHNDCIWDFLSKKLVKTNLYFKYSRVLNRSPCVYYSGLLLFQKRKGQTVFLFWNK